MALAVSKENKVQYPMKIPLPESFIYEDDKCVVFVETVRPQASEHFLIVPKKLLPRFESTEEEDERFLGYLLLVAIDVAVQRGLTSTGFHVIMDEDYQNKRLRALHVFGRALHHMVWPMGPGCRL